MWERGLAWVDKFGVCMHIDFIYIFRVYYFLFTLFFKQ